MVTNAIRLKPHILIQSNYMCIEQIVTRNGDPHCTRSLHSKLDVIDDKFQLCCVTLSSLFLVDY
jgi:hypothetical protein